MDRKLVCNSCKHMDVFKIKHNFYHKNIKYLVKIFFKSKRN